MRHYLWINNVGTTTGRESSEIHTLPYTVRTLYKPDTPDYYFFDADYRQMELRLLFALAGETGMIKASQDPDVDIHRTIFSQINGVEPWEVSEEDRKDGKATNFGVVFGMSGFGLASNKKVNPSKQEVRVAERAIKDFYQAFKAVTRYQKGLSEKVQQDGFVETLFKRRRYFPRIKYDDISSRERSAILRQAKNFPMQGTGADITKISQLAIEAEFKKLGLNNLIKTPYGMFPLARLVFSVHDEILMCVHKSIPVEVIMKIARDAMEISIGEPAMPLYTGGSVIDTFHEGKIDKYEIPNKLRDRMITNYERTGKSIVTWPYKESMVTIIEDYHKNEIETYMEEMSRGVTTVQELADKIKHPNLTHVLIGMYKSKEHKRLSHRERIEYACECYLKNIVQEERPIEEVHAMEAKDLEEQDRNIALFRDLTYDEEFEEELEEKEILKDEDLLNKVYVWQFLNKVIIDGTNNTRVNANKVSEYFKTHYGDENGIYEVEMSTKDNIEPLNYKVKEFNFEKVNQEIIAFLEKESEDE